MLLLMAALGAGVVVGIPRLLKRCVAPYVADDVHACKQEPMVSNHVDVALL